MKKIIFAILSMALLLTNTACNDYETYADQKKKERAAIDQFINDSAFVVISEAQFQEQGGLTKSNKEFVLLDKSGIYMQIVRKGCGTPVEDGENTTLLCRFKELNIENATYLYNDVYYVHIVDKMFVQRTGSTFSASFVEGLMYEQYGASVPEGWLIPLQYVNVGRPAKDGDEISKVRLIVPHSMGTASSAKSYVYPCYYEITFERER